MVASGMQKGSAVEVVEGHCALHVDGRFHRLVAAGDTAFAAWPRTHLEPLGEAVHRPFDDLHTAAARELRALRSQRSRQTQGLTQFLGPGAAPPPGPYALPGARLVLAVVRHPALRVLMPPWMHSVVFDDRCLLVFAEFPEAHGRTDRGEPVALAYCETSIMMPVLGARLGGVGMFCPALWPDNLMAGLVGRELFGLPKRFGVTDFADGAAAFSLRGELAAVLTWQGEEPIDTRTWLSDYVTLLLGEDLVAGLLGELSSGLPVEKALKAGMTAPIYVQRRAAAFEAEDRNWTTDEIRGVETGLGAVREVEVLDAELDLRVPFLVGGELVAAWRCEVDMVFAESRAVWDGRRPLGGPLLGARAALSRLVDVAAALGEE